MISVLSGAVFKIDFSLPEEAFASIIIYKNTAGVLAERFKKAQELIGDA